jgi:hypothetical protein
MVCEDELVLDVVLEDQKHVKSTGKHLGSKQILSSCFILAAKHAFLPSPTSSMNSLVNSLLGLLAKSSPYPVFGCIWAAHIFIIV